MLAQKSQLHSTCLTMSIAPAGMLETRRVPRPFTIMHFVPSLSSPGEGVFLCANLGENSVTGKPKMQGLVDSLKSREDALDLQSDHCAERSTDSRMFPIHNEQRPIE